MADLVSTEAFRAWTGSATATVPDELIEACLGEAEAGIIADLGVPIPVIQASAAASDLAYGEELRRASRLLARRNSPESVVGFGEMSMILPSRDPDSIRTLSAIRSLLMLPEGVA